MPDSPARLILDDTKLAWHPGRVDAWDRGERIAPLTIDMALTRACQFRCEYCYSQMQHNPGRKITWEVAHDFLLDAANAGVWGIVLMSDGESTLVPFFPQFVHSARQLGLAVALATNGYLFDEQMAHRVLPDLTYIRVNISAATPERYGEIMGVPLEWFGKVKRNLSGMVRVKELGGLATTIGMQQVLMPQYADQVLPLARLAIELGVDYLVIKHCSDDLEGSLGVDYGAYEELAGLLAEAEALSTEHTRIVVKWSKIKAGTERPYRQCYAPPFLLQISGSGLVSACGPLFSNPDYAIGNICETPFREILKSDRYWEVMDRLRSPDFDTATMCGGYLCVQHNANVWLDNRQKAGGFAMRPSGERPAHWEFA